MRGRTFDARHLEVAALAERGVELAGELPLAELKRLLEGAHPDAPPTPAERVRWEARGERRRGTGGVGQDWLHLRARAPLRMVCQRCLQAVEYELEVDNSFRFVADEATAAALDAEAEEDLLVEHALVRPARP